jgi:hypothetical protein
VSGRRAHAGARHLTPIAALLALTALLLLAFFAQCLHLPHTSHGGPAATASAAVPATHAGADGTCDPGVKVVSATTRCADAPRDDPDVVPRVPSVHEAVTAHLPLSVAVRGQTGQPHGWNLLLLLVIALT